MFRDIIGGIGIRHPHEQLGVAVVQNGVGPVNGDFRIELIDRLAVAIDIQPSPTGLCKELFDTLIKNRLGLINMQGHGW